MKKQAKKNNKFTVIEVGALIEDFRSQFKAFGEGLNNLKEKIDALTGIVNHEAKKSDLSRMDIASLKTDVASLKTDVASLKTDVASLKTDVASLKTDVASLKTDVANLKTDVANLKNTAAQINSRLTGIEKDVHLISDNLGSKVEHKEFELLEKKVASLSD